MLSTKDDTVVIPTLKLWVWEHQACAISHRDGEVAHVRANRHDHRFVEARGGEAGNSGHVAVGASRCLVVNWLPVGDKIGGEDDGTGHAGRTHLGDGQVHAYAAFSGAGEVVVGHGVEGVVVVGRADSSVVGVGAIDVLGGEGKVAQPATFHSPSASERWASKARERDRRK